MSERPPQPDSNSHESDDLPQFQDIPRRSPVVRAEFNGGIEVGMTWYNTRVVVYPEDYRDMDHIEVVDRRQGLRGIIFNEPRHVSELLDKQFPALRAPEPTKRVLDAYVRWKQSQIPDSPNFE